VTSSISRLSPPAHSSRGAHKDRCACVYRGECMLVYVRACICTVFLKRAGAHLTEIFLGSDTELLNGRTKMQQYRAGLYCREQAGPPGPVGVGLPMAAGHWGLCCLVMLSGEKRPKPTMPWIGLDGHCWSQPSLGMGSPAQKWPGPSGQNMLSGRAWARICGPTVKLGRAWARKTGDLRKA
jgi:hypothetical protein